MSKIVTIIDCDFFNHITESSKDIKNFEALIKDLNIQPIVHEYVYKEELFSNNCAKKMLECGLLKEEKFDDFINEKNKNEYIRYFETFYKYANGMDIVYKKNNYKTYRKSGENLGEIHSLCLALIKVYPMFLSDDSGAKRLNASIEKKSKIMIKNIYEVYEDIAKLKNKLTTKDMFLSVMTFSGVKKELVKKIKMQWAQN